ncbi:hypothetical protein M885DRAFT_520795 [Pelagophyceae sp. CCMP2097]|nr:hypothetical protein M885DRAFT_520795 [Pelagophyceae sp. CCMP2097]|mmetsp:Transcript_864/g.3070  ORF Transcript_864/g.3070 Transcript_864/m.3070 type:complete len:253 (-) Transcript_864:175-933(-)
MTAAAPWQWTGVERVLDDVAGALDALRLDDVSALADVAACAGADALRLPTTSKALALHEAVEYAAINAVAYLVDFGFAEVDGVDGAMWTALHYASVYHPDNIPLAHALLCRCAEVAKRDDCGATPETAADDGDAAGVAELLRGVALAGSYEAWACQNVDDAIYGPLIAAARPDVVQRERRLQLALLKYQVDRLELKQQVDRHELCPRSAQLREPQRVAVPADAACCAALAFAFGTDGGKGHNVFATIARFVV